MNEKVLKNKFNTKKVKAPVAPPPPEYRNCFALADVSGECRALTEKMCVTRGKCKFYRPKGHGEENELELT